MTKPNRIVVPPSQSAQSAQAVTGNDLKRVVARIKCFEPNSQTLDFTGEDLCRNSLFIGTVGSGKTTCMNPMLRDIIHYRAGEAAHKIGLLVIDSKVDETVPKIKQWAREAGRTEDVQVLSPDDVYYYDFLADLKDFSSLEMVVEKIMASIAWSEGPNDYWNHGRKPLLKAALAIILVNNLAADTTPDYRESIRFLLDWLVMDGSQGSLAKEKISRFQDRVQQNRTLLTHGELAIVDETLATIRMWDHLDSKTKSNWGSVMVNCLSPFSDMASQLYFNPQGRQRINVSEILDQGRIIILSVNAGENPGLAKLIGRMVKADFYNLLQARQLAFADQGRLIGLILDEYPLVVTSNEPRFGDIAQLQSLRSKRGFVVAASQGFASLDMVVGSRSREALQLNFNNLFFFNSHEPEVDVFAKVHFGRKPGTMKTSVQWQDFAEDGSVVADRQNRRISAETEAWSCPVGALSKLEVGQAYVSLAGGQTRLTPAWIEPLYYDLPIAPPAKPESRHAALKNIFDPMYVPCWDGNDAAGTEGENEPPCIFENPPEEIVDTGFGIDLEQTEYVDLFLAPEGLVSRYIKLEPDALGKIKVVPTQDDGHAYVAVIFPPGMIPELIKQVEPKTPTDHEFLKYYNLRYPSI